MGIFAQALISGEEIKDYIPQREPIIMVDSFYGVDGSKSYSGLTVNQDNIFVENGCLNESGIIEHIAQSCALRVGYVCKTSGQPIPIGYIGALKNLKIHNLPKTGQALETTVTILQEVFDISLAGVEVKCEGTTIAEGEMKIFLTK
ncbi:MAG: hydroxymyristoyl-ACP dehydratase [Dysgonamonadaceae bacterium]|jgi:predicted hotdog family 3-hydroxylacyl-ACP dehydratase|nr:hydroxymyristoyl-ACP dehydratase [Dysgonamonadaceae bacterium]